MKRSEKKNFTWLILVVGLVIVLLSVNRCSRRVEENLQIEMEKTLADIAEQSAVSLRKEIVGKYRLLNGIAADMQLNPGQEDVILDEMRVFVDSYNFLRMGYVGPDGVGLTTDGYEVDLGDWEFFKQGMEGKRWLTGTKEGSITDPEDRINVFSVPVRGKDGDSVGGVAFATYQNENFQDLMSIDFFDGNGFSCVIEGNGNVVVHSQNSPLKNETNFLEYLRGKHEDGEDVAAQMQAVMESGDAGSGKFDESDGYMPLTYYYLPLFDKMYGSPWYIVVLAPGQVLTERVDPIMRHVDKLAVILVGITLFGIGFYAYMDRRRKQELIRLAYDDSVTGGFNFVCFKEAVKKRKGIPGYLLAMDLTEFKLINSTRGLQKGDETLREIWQTILKNLHQGELAARVNADRFVLFLFGDDNEILEQRLERLISDITHLADKLNIPKIFPVFGIYQTDRADEADKCYGCAVQAKHLVKGRRDRHYAFYDEIDHEQVLENRKLEDSFEEALATGQFEMWYQPKYSGETGEITGAEALVRWRTPDGKLLSPGIFIPLFEKNGYITILDEYIFRKVCAQQKKWLDEGKNVVPVSVNISRVSLYFINIVERYADIVQEIGLDTRYVQLEITESAMIDNANIAHLIEGFHRNGFAVLLDDFGSGYSSLASLNTMQFDTLKLDKSLIDYIGDDKGEKLLKYITMLAQSLGLHITAEGVETQRQLEFLQTLKCDGIQGYFYSKPLPVDEYLQKL